METKSKGFIITYTTQDGETAYLNKFRMWGLHNMKQDAEVFATEDGAKMWKCTFIKVQMGPESYKQVSVRPY